MKRRDLFKMLAGGVVAAAVPATALVALFKPAPYHDVYRQTLGFWTIGAGRLSTDAWRQDVPRHHRYYYPDRAPMIEANGCGNNAILRLLEKRMKNSEKTMAENLSKLFGSNYS